MGFQSNRELADLEASYQSIRAEAVRLAGDNRALAQRATVYHHLYRHSGGNHVFPLIAAHGALWARGYFDFGVRLGTALSIADRNAASRQKKRRLLREFADAFRDINRLVCIETYTTYHFTRLHGDAPLASRFIANGLLDWLNRMHVARKSGETLDQETLRAVFECFFRNEQITVVGPRIRQAVGLFDWPGMRRLALAPRVRFAYFPWYGMQFRNFESETERVRNGMRAFDFAAQRGFAGVERDLLRYRVLPANFVRESERYFEVIRRAASVQPAVN